VALGTIEPRKNIELLVKIWRVLLTGQAPVPHLYVIGNRGWADPALFADLGVLVATGAVTVLHNATDAAVTAMLLGAEALLFPSLAEGYALPPIEAAALGVPVMAGKLPVVVERLGDYPVYLDTSDVYAWVDAIKQQMQEKSQGQNVKRQSRFPPTWADHFDLVFGES
jgi:glycosyltransferase involved in cell wall biosynthesis